MHSEDNQIFKQKGSTCVGFAVINAAEHVTGTKFFEEDVYNYYKKHNLSLTSGISVEKFLNMMMNTPLHGVKVKSWERVFDVDDWTSKKYYMAKVRTALNHRDQHAVIATINFRNYGLTLNDKNILLATGKEITGLHEVYLSGIKQEIKPNKQYYMFEDSKGVNWGDNGNFFMDLNDWFTEIDRAHVVHFEKVE